MIKAKILGHADCGAGAGAMRAHSRCPTGSRPLRMQLPHQACNLARSASSLYRFVLARHTGSTLDRSCQGRCTGTAILKGTLPNVSVTTLLSVCLQRLFLMRHRAFV